MDIPKRIIGLKEGHPYGFLQNHREHYSAKTFYLPMPETVQDVE